MIGNSVLSFNKKLATTGTNTLVIPNLVARWKFDNNANDYFGTNNGTILGTVSYSASVPSRINFPDSASLSCSSATTTYCSIPPILYGFNTEATFSVWVKCTENTPTTAGNGLAHLGSDTAAATHYVWTDGNFYTAIFRQSRFGSIVLPAVDRTQWHHLAITTKPGTNGYTVYQNAVPVFTGTGESAVSLPITNNILLGRSVNGINFNGSLDDARLYNRCLTQTEITSLYNGINDESSPFITGSTSLSVRSRVSEYTPEHHWTFDGISSNTKKDKYSNISFTFPGTYSTNPIDGSVTLLAGNYAVTDTTLNYGSQSFSVGIWVKLAISASAWGRVLDQSMNGSDGFYLGIDSTGGKYKFIVDKNVDLGTAEGGVVSRGRWQHLTATYDATSGDAKLYVDGNLVGTSNFPAYVVTPRVLYINGASSANPSFNGSFRDVKFFNKTLTATEVAKIYNNDPFNDILATSSAYSKSTGYFTSYINKNLISIGTETLPIYTGTSAVSKSKNLVLKGNSLVPVYTSSASLAKTYNFISAGSVLSSVYTSTASLLISHPLLGAIGVNAKPTYIGTASVYNYKSIISTGNFTVPNYSSTASLLISHPSFVDNGLNIKPVYIGSSSLSQLSRKASVFGVATYEIPIYAGKAYLYNKINIDKNLSNITNVPVYFGATKLQFSHNEFLFNEEFIVPVYSTSTTLSKYIKLQGYYKDVIDDNDTDTDRVSSNYDWVLSNNYGYNGTEYHYFPPSTDSSMAWWQWTYGNLPNDKYDIFVTWVPNSNRPTSVRYDVITPNNSVFTYYLNQRLSPVGSIYGGVVFQKLCSVYAVDNISIRVYADENYYTIADATMIVYGNKFIIPNYSGSMLINIPINYSISSISKVPIFASSAVLAIDKVEFLSETEFDVPIYGGLSNVNVQKVLISNGVNIFKGIIYKRILYVTDVKRVSRFM